MPETTDLNEQTAKEKEDIKMTSRRYIIQGGQGENGDAQCECLVLYSGLFGGVKNRPGRPHPRLFPQRREAQPFHDPGHP